MNRSRVILAALLGVLVLCLLYAYLAMPRLEKAPPREALQRARAVTARAGTDVPARVQQGRIDFTFLDVRPQKFPGAKRDIFRFGQHRAVRGEPAGPADLTPQEQPPAVVLPLPVMPIEAVQQALGNFTFLGFLEKAGEKTVFLSSGGSLFLAKRGERFGAGQEFLVEEIAGNLLKVSHAGREGVIEIPLIEQKKLSASVSAPARMPAVADDPGQARSRVFPPQRRTLRPAAPQGAENAVPELNEETAPEQEQQAEPPAEGGVLEGEVNGKNQ